MPSRQASPATDPPPAPVQIDPSAPTVGSVYPQLASSALVFARLMELADGVLPHGGDTIITSKDIEAEIAQAPRQPREERERNAFFLLEQMAARKLLLHEGRRQAGGGAADRDADALLRSHVDAPTAGARVSDQESEQFYQANRRMTDGTALGRFAPSFASTCSMPSEVPGRAAAGPRRGHGVAGEGLRVPDGPGVRAGGPGV